MVVHSSVNVTKQAVHRQAASSATQVCREVSHQFAVPNVKISKTTNTIIALIIQKVVDNFGFVGFSDITTQ